MAKGKVAISKTVPTARGRYIIIKYSTYIPTEYRYHLHKIVEVFVYRRWAVIENLPV